MLHDLSGDATMAPVVGMLYAAVEENNRRLRFITEGMTIDELDFKGPGNRYNSTAQLIRHVMRVDLGWVYRIKGVPLPAALIERYGPMIDERNRLPGIEGVALNSLMAQYDEVLKLLRDVCKQLADADLGKVVAYGHANEKQATLRWGLWHMADHSRYHQAHINQLRKWYGEHASKRPE